MTIESVLTEPAMGEVSGGVAALPDLTTPGESNTDSPGSQFDEAIATGEPIAAPEPRKRGRPSKAELAARLNGVTRPPPAPSKMPQPVVPMIATIDYDAMALLAASMFFGGGELLLGEDWAPTEGEPRLIKDAFKAYFVSIKATEIPPSMGLCFALGIYTVNRVNKPTIKSKIYGAYSWLKSKLPFRR